jgi:hypothetical protein
LPAGLLRPTTPARPVESAEEPAEPVEAADAAEGEGQGRGDATQEARPARTRRKRPPVSGETKGRKLHLPDQIHDRLKLVALQRRTTASAIAAEILDRNLPRLRIEREG